MTLSSYQFSSDAPQPDILEGKTPMEFLRSKYTRGCIFGLDHLKSRGVYRLRGWEFNFRPYMKRFVVRQYGTWQEYYAPNKTALRNSIYGEIQKIVEFE